jgi:hypothetical protein
MDVKESYRLLELEIGASRAAIEAAYFKMMERWHPDRVAPSAGPEAVQEAHRMVAQVNEAYRTLDKIAPKAEAPAPTPPAGAPAPPPKSRISSLAADLIAEATPAPKPKPPISNLAPTPAPARVVTAAELEPAKAPEPEPEPDESLRTTIEKMLPVDPKKRLGVIIGAVAVLLLLVILVGNCSSKPTRRKSEAPDPATTGRLVVKSNRANATIEATRVPAAGEAPTAAVKGSPTGAPEQALTGLPPGSYVLLTRSDGWPESRQDLTLTAGQTTEVAINFKSGSLRLDSIPGAANVKFGETILGKTPLVIPQLPVGESTLSVEYPGWPARPVKVTISEGVEASEIVRLPHGRLVVESVPAGATVLLGTRPVGQTPVTFERVAAGTWKVTLQAKEFTTVEQPVTIEDEGEVKVSQVLKSNLPILDPPATLAAVWLDNIGRKNDLSPDFNQPINFRPNNGIVRNLNRKALFESWLAKRFRYSGTVKSYNPETGIVEFTDENGEKSKYVVLAQLTMGARSDKEIVAQLTKGATFALYGRLSAVEEPRWPAKVIAFEITGAEPQR